MDKTIRIVLGIVIIGYGVMEQSLFGLIGILPVATALMSLCPLYLIFGISMCGLKKVEE